MGEGPGGFVVFPDSLTTLTGCHYDLSTAGSTTSPKGSPAPNGQVYVATETEGVDDLIQGMGAA
jgi:hypothetical protein